GESVVGSARSQQRQRTRRRIHAVPGVDIVLDEDRDAVKWPARPLRLALLVKRVGDLESLRVELDNGVDHRAGFVDLLNACQVLLGQRAGGILTGQEGLLYIVN